MVDKFKYFPNDYYLQNYSIFRFWLKCFNTQLNDQSNQNLHKSSKLLSQRIRKRYYKTLRTSVIKSPLSPLNQAKFGYVTLIFFCYFVSLVNILVLVNSLHLFYILHRHRYIPVNVVDVLTRRLLEIVISKGNRIYKI